MSAIFKIWNSYISPATDGGLDIGSESLRFNDLWLMGTAYFSSLTMLGNLYIPGYNIVTDTTTGTRIGTSTIQKLGFFNATPVIQPIQTADLQDNLISLGLIADGTSAYPIDLHGGTLTAGAVLTSSFYRSGTTASGYILTSDVSGYGTWQPPAGTFLSLTDTPSSYSGMAASGVRVTSGANALEFYPVAGVTGTYILPSGTTGQLATITFNNGICTAVTLV